MSTNPRRKPGPAPAFDADAALDAAMGLFWDRGYADVSMADLLDATGIGRQSFYNAFESKPAVFRRCVDRYVDRHQSHLLAKLDSDPSPDASLVEFLATWEKQTGGGGPGCLLINVYDDLPVLEPDAAECIRQAVARFETRVAARLADAVEADEITPTMPPTRVARILVATGNGLMLGCRDGRRHRNAGLLVDTYRALAPRADNRMHPP